MKKDMFSMPYFKDMQDSTEYNFHKPISWGILILIFVICFCITIWMIFGQISKKVDISGIVFPQAGLKSLVFTGDAIEPDVTHVQFMPGDVVKEGDIIAVIPNTDILDEIAKVYKDGKITPEITALRQEYVEQSIIVSPYNGRIVDVIEKGTIIRKGEKVATIVPYDKYTNEKEIRAYIPDDIASMLKTGMEVLISPRFAPKEKYGHINGIVSKVSDFIESKEDVKKSLGNFYTEDIIPESDNFVEVRITIMIDDSSSGILGLDGSKSKELKVDIGNICNMQVILSKQRPIELISLKTY